LGCRRRLAPGLRGRHRKRMDWPLQRTLEALSQLRQGQRLRMLIDREPRPLYRILEGNGYRYQAELRDDYVYEITIWSREA
jgi:uncharacterized protein (DUF2249 family)